MPIQQPFIFYPQNDQLINWGPLITGSSQYSSSPVYVNDAIGTATILDPSGNPVSGADAVPFSYVAQSNGMYIASISAGSFNPSLIAPGYSTVIVLTSSSLSAKGMWTIPTIIKLRNSS